MVRLNTLISTNQKLAATLEDETFNLQRSVLCELKDLEAKAQHLERDIGGAAQRKQDALSDILDTERQIMLWERKIQLEKEMREILDPSAGQVCFELTLPCLARQVYIELLCCVALRKEFCDWKRKRRGLLLGLELERPPCRTRHPCNPTLQFYLQDVTGSLEKEIYGL